MSTDERTVILRAYRPFLTYLTVYKLNNFRNKERRVLLRNVSRAVGVALLIVLTFLFLSSQLAACYEYNFALDKTVQCLAYAILGIQLLCIYLVMFWESHKAIDIFEYLHKVVVESMSVLHIFMLGNRLFCLLTNCSYFFFYSGSSLTQQLLINYEANEQRYAHIIKTIAKVGCLCVAPVYALSALFPISYTFFNYPQPDEWALPMEYT